MAIAPIELRFGITGRAALTIDLYPLGSDTVSAVVGLAMTEATNRKGTYTATTTAGLSGWYEVVLKDGGVYFPFVGYVSMDDTTANHLIVDSPVSAGGGGGGGDATAANQVTMLADLVSIQALLNTLSTGGAGSFSPVVLPGNKIKLIPGDDYYASESRRASWVLAGQFADLTSATILFVAYTDQYRELFSCAGTVTVASGSTQAVAVEFPAADTVLLPPNTTGLNYGVWATYPNTHRVQLVDGANKLSTGDIYQAPSSC